MLRKVFVCTLALLLMSETVLFAAPAQELPTVQQSRDRALATVQDASGFDKKDKLIMISLIGTLGVLMTIIHRTTVQMRKEAAQKALAKTLEAKALPFKKSSPEEYAKILEKKLKESQRQVAYLNKKVAGLSQQQQVHAQKMNDATANIAKLKQALKEKTNQNAALWTEIQNMEEFFKSNINVDKYAALYGKSEKEIKSALDIYLKEDFLKNYPHASVAEVKMLKESLMVAYSMPYRQSTVVFLRQFASAPAHISVFMRNLSKKIASKNMLVWGMLFASGALMYDSEIGRQLNRLYQNPALLLSLTDEEAEVLNESAAAREACALIAEAYEELGALSAEDREILYKSYSHPRMTIAPAVLAH